ncbi:MAG: hypothetical protein QNJ46_16035 [Leptolyngbyaceae cyanobacterium MO_188.B28]|nr:hypothetical protein [Leptolyngbyaceae cyanobacterium MO_188.B28]
MNFPLILELAIGLIFTYLTLSLVASEIQEIISTLLQWRAEHLKYSIEKLLSGDTQTSQAVAQDLANRLYESPIIQDLNHEARGRIARLFRAVLQRIGFVYRWLTRTRNVFGKQTSGPSYIPSEAFAASLLENLQFDNIYRVITESRLKKFVEERLQFPVNHILNDLKASEANEFILEAELKQFEQALYQILEDFQAHRVNLAQTIDRMLGRLDDFIEAAAGALPEDNQLSQTFLRRLRYLKRNIVRNLEEKSALLNKIEPTIEELISVLDGDSETYQEAIAIAAQEGGAAEAVLSRLKTLKLPPQLTKSLRIIANETQIKLQTADNRVYRFQQEVEGWFDRSMERASGVYKRNSRGIALLIGFALAIAVNADTFHITDRLLVDQTIRNSISQMASQAETSSNPDDLAEELGGVKDAVSDTLKELPLPIGRDQIILNAQKEAQNNWGFPIPRRVLGWIVTGVAISMGSNFWFDLLKKVINVKSTGKAAR